MPKVRRLRRRQQSEPPSLWTAHEVAEMFRKTPRRIQQLAKSGALPGFREQSDTSPLGKGVQWLFKDRDVAKFFRMSISDARGLHEQMFKGAKQ